MKYLPGQSVTDIIYNVIVIYLVLSAVLTFVSIIRMYALEKKTCGKAYGRARFKELQSTGRLKILPVYTPEEIKGKHALGDVRITFFPADDPTSDRFVMICPGGGYAHLCTKTEGYPVAAKFNELGVNAFILDYRTGLSCSPYSPMHDMAKAIRYISAHQEDFGVTIKDYAICGFSAGGNLATIFASDVHEHGYKAYGVEKPGALFLGYPWTNMIHWLAHPYWNIWLGLISIWLCERGFTYMFGPFASRKKRDGLDVKKAITKDYPAVYMYAGSLDTLVPASRHADLTASVLKEYGIKHNYQKFFRLPHGIGLGIGTAAEVWPEEALKLWNED